ncbi:MAG: methyltransferase domain-containing protein [Bacteroidota bacterium]
MSDNLWDRRYSREGEIWNTSPSLTARFISQNIPVSASLFEIGFGYGRDLVALTKKGYNVTGIEASSIGRSMAVESLKNSKITSSPWLLQGDFLNAVLPHQKFDVVYSHRVIHLLQDDYAVNAYRDRVLEIIKDKGHLLLSARDPRGVKPSRKGHHVSFWDAERFERVFGKDFAIEQLIEGEEIESASNPVPTYFTLMVARRRVQKLIP